MSHSKGSLRRLPPPLTRDAERPAKTPSLKAKRLPEVQANVEDLIESLECTQPVFHAVGRTLTARIL